MSCTPLYAPPEAILAHVAREQLTVTPALDIWALGVIIYECLTGQVTFSRFSGMEEVLGCAQGTRPYPWERPAAEQPPEWRKARARPVFERCLARDPGLRPTASTLMQYVRRLDSMTTQHADGA